MNSELSKDNSPVKMTEEEYFNKASAAVGNPEKLAELKKLNVEIVPNQEVEATPPTPEPVKEEEKKEEQVEETAKEPAVEVKEKETKVKEQPFDKDAAPDTKESSTPKKSDEATSVAPSSDEVGTLRSELDAVKKDRDEWRHKFTSNAGRIAAYQKTIADLKNQITLLQGDSRPDKAATKEDVKKPNRREHPAFEKLKNIDPDLAEVVDQLLSAEKAEVTEQVKGDLKNTHKVIADTQHRSFLEQEHAKLRSAVTNLDEVLSSKEFAYFQENVASPQVKKLLESDFADDALVGLQIYGTWLDGAAQFHSKEEKPEPVKEEPKKKEEAKPAAEDIAKVVEARDRRLKATDVSSSQTPPKGSGEIDLEAEFLKTYNKTLAKVLPKR